MHVDGSDALAADQDLTTFGRARGRLLGGIEQTATCENDRSSRLGSGLEELSSIEHGVDSSSVYSIRLQETEREERTRLVGNPARRGRSSGSGRSSMRRCPAASQSAAGGSEARACGTDHG